MRTWFHFTPNRVYSSALFNIISMSNTFSIYTSSLRPKLFLHLSVLTRLRCFENFISGSYFFTSFLHHLFLRGERTQVTQAYFKYIHIDISIKATLLNLSPLFYTMHYVCVKFKFQGILQTVYPSLFIGLKGL